MERGLDQAALARVKLAFAGEQAFAEQNLGAFEDAALDEVGLMGDEDVADPVGMGDFIHRLGAELEVDQIAVGALGSLEELGGFAAEPGEDAEDGWSFEHGGLGSGGGEHTSFSVYGVGSFGNFGLLERSCCKCLKAR